ncbi:hypothetical protein LY76DRAFT_188745 [Colletotrichum caudatum]|nr:hypothetical protein LY76DRAFT_188745 [Colletotrichum caudatum]
MFKSARSLVLQVLSFMAGNMESISDQCQLDTIRTHHYAHPIANQAEAASGTALVAGLVIGHFFMLFGLRGHSLCLFGRFLHACWSMNGRVAARKG